MSSEQKNLADQQNDPLQSWQGSFGESYIQRNLATADVTAEATAVFGRILDAARIRSQVTSVLEVGANVGINLVGLRGVLGAAARLAALEPNASAREALSRNTELNLDRIIAADAYAIPVPDHSYDLTFTNGVLIHVPPDRLQEAMREITRASGRYVLCSEYFSHTPVEISYHGQSGLLWKRDFGRLYLDTCPELRPVAYGFIWQAEFPHFDDLNWWLFEKVR